MLLAIAFPAVVLFPFRLAYSLVGLPDPSRNPSFFKSGIRFRSLVLLRPRLCDRYFTVKASGTLAFAILSNSVAIFPYAGVYGRSWVIVRRSPDQIGLLGL